MPKGKRLTRGSFPSRFAFRTSGSLVSVAVAPLKNGTHKAKYACVVSKKVARKAVDRNALKRRCRHILSSYSPALPPVALVAYPKKEALEASYAELEKELHALIDKALVRIS